TGMRNPIGYEFHRSNCLGKVCILCKCKFDKFSYSFDCLCKISLIFGYIYF
ncbi:hypothetical protein TorRG33x02_185510, partial [Trema orientale]